MLLGAHLSVSKGFDAAALAAREIGANTFQFFTRNPRGGAARAISEAEVQKWLDLKEHCGIGPVVGHLPYTVNMAAPADKAYDFARMVVRDELKRMGSAKVELLVTHPGSHAGSGREAGMRRIVQCLEEAMQEYSGPVVLLLETMAGQGSELGTLQDIFEIISALGSSPNIGVCLDSCHLTAVGYDFLCREEADRLADDLEEIIGLRFVRALHLNDSKFPPGSHKDRHERIGRGYLGKEGILNLITHPAFAGLPMLLETPVEDARQYGEEITLIRSWLAEAAL